MLDGYDTGYFSSQLDGLSPAPETKLDLLRFGDVRDLTAEHLSGYDFVVHLAAISNDPIGDRFAAITDDVNHRQSVRIAKLAKASGAQGFTFASSASVYGIGSSGRRSESDPLAPQTAYARSKVATEAELAGVADESFAVTCFRFSTACGWSPRIRLDLVLNDFVASAITTAKITVLSDGTPWRPLVHVRDMARAIEWSVSPDRLALRPLITCNVGQDSWNFQIGELAQHVANEIGSVEVDINTAAQADRRSYRVDFSLWKSLAPNHQPQEDLAETIRELQDQLADLPDLSQDFRGSSRIRLQRLQQLTEGGWLDKDLRWRQGDQR